MKLIETIAAALATYRADSARALEIKRQLGLSIDLEDADLTVNKDGFPVIKGSATGAVVVSKDTAAEIRKLRTRLRLGRTMKDAGMALGALDQLAALYTAAAARVDELEKAHESAAAAAAARIAELEALVHAPAAPAKKKAA